MMTSAISLPFSSEKDATRLLKKVLTHFVRERKTRVSKVKRHTRYVQERTAREVKVLAAYQCQYVSPKGIRCNQRAHLQIDHIRPWAKSGSSHDLGNLRCLCRAHNLYLAKLDFPNKLVFRANTPLMAKSLQRPRYFSTPSVEGQDRKSR